MSNPDSSLSSFGASSRIRVQSALHAMRNGVPVVLVDDEDRENEGDLIIAAEKLTEQTMALLIRECSGIVCLCLTPQRVQQLQLVPMVRNNQSRQQTAFAVSIEARNSVTTGVCPADRVTTIQSAIHRDAKPEDLVSPGHVFPLRAAAGGVLERRGHTEGSVDLARLAGLQPAAVLCELMNADGSMARWHDIVQFATQRRFPVLSIDDLVSCRRARKQAA